MPFSLTSALANFHRFLDEVFTPFFDLFATAYLDDILIYSNNLEEHQE
jgi:hypothetical protein